MLANVIPTWLASKERVKMVGTWCVWEQEQSIHILFGFPCSVCILFLILFPLLPFSFVCLYHLSSLSLCAHAHKIFISHAYSLFSVLIFLPSFFVNKLCWLQMFPIWQHLRLRFSSHTTEGVLAPSSCHPTVWDGAIPSQKQGMNLPSPPNLGSQSSLRSIEQKENRSWAMILGVVINSGVQGPHPCASLVSLKWLAEGEVNQGQCWDWEGPLCSVSLFICSQNPLKADVGHICFPPTWLDLAPTLTTTSKNIYRHCFWGLVLSPSL